MGSVHARGDTFLTFGVKALTETNTSRLATGTSPDGVTTQKTNIDIFTAVRTSNLTMSVYL
jgi:hypothetical protein